MYMGRSTNIHTVLNSSCKYFADIKAFLPSIPPLADDDDDVAPTLFGTDVEALLRRKKAKSYAGVLLFDDDISVYISEIYSRIYTYLPVCC